ncbi:MAG: putative selenium-dependent hydroxylase accessory protein YqeC, partial [Deltaproteobacteria bacterium]|nr:putative selenium-dependent hydroxylase accessory protein YqeC [Deltaproteobacteria bacterium]
HATVAHHLLPSGNKLQGVNCEQVEHILEHSSANRMLVEADGARQLSFKAPGHNEPVVPQITDVFINVLGLDIIGKPLVEENVFRAGLVSSRTGLRMGSEITPLTVAKLASHPQGLLKGCPKKARSYIFLNKTDIPGGKEKALSVIEATRNIQGIKPDFWISGSIRKNECKSYKGS